MQNLPHDLIRHVFDYYISTPRDLSYIELVGKQFQEILSVKSFWAKFGDKRFSFPTTKQEYKACLQSSFDEITAEDVEAMFLYIAENDYELCEYKGSDTTVYIISDSPKAPNLLTHNNFHHGRAFQSGHVIVSKVIEYNALPTLNFTANFACLIAFDKGSKESFQIAQNNIYLIQKKLNMYKTPSILIGIKSENDVVTTSEMEQFAKTVCVPCYEMNENEEIWQGTKNKLTEMAAQCCALTYTAYGLPLKHAPKYLHYVPPPQTQTTTAIQEQQSSSCVLC